MGVETVDAVVVGAGPAGLSASWCLARDGVEHVVLEQAQVGDSWRTQRWDSFHLVTPSDQVRLPGGDRLPPGFPAAGRLVALLEQLAAPLPIRTGVQVSRAVVDGGRYRLATSQGELATRAVVVASGGLRRPYVPGLSSRLPDWLPQRHTADYRRPDLLPAGAVLVVGSGQSGAQVASELAAAGRRVVLATSRVGYLPRRYRGRDVTEWALAAGMFDEPPAEAEPGIRAEPQPIMTGHGGGRTLTLPQLAREGVELAGRYTGADEDNALFADDLAANLSYSEDAARRLCAHLDALIVRSGLTAPPPGPDPAAAPVPGLEHGPRHLDLAREGFGVVLWATGFRPAHDWLGIPVLDERGGIRHRAGATPAPGVHVVGYPWLSHRGSGLLYGMRRDAEHAAAAIGGHLGRAAG